MSIDAMSITTNPDPQVELKERTAALAQAFLSLREEFPQYVRVEMSTDSMGAIRVLLLERGET